MAREFPRCIVFLSIFSYIQSAGQVAKLANALALGASAARLVGSTPTLPTSHEVRPVMNTGRPMFIIGRILPGAPKQKGGHKAKGGSDPPFALSSHLHLFYFLAFNLWNAQGKYPVFHDSFCPFSVYLFWQDNLP